MVNVACVCACVTGIWLVLKYEKEKIIICFLFLFLKAKKTLSEQTTIVNDEKKNYIFQEIKCNNY